MRDDFEDFGFGRDEVLAHLEQGMPLEALASSTSATPIQIVESLGAVALEANGGLGPTLVQHAPPHPKIARALSAESLARLHPGTSRRTLLALSAGLLQLHDFWEESHAAAQEADDLGEREFSAYWHGIAHRREPDAGNASYWFRRVGRHAIFPALHEEACGILEEAVETDRAIRLVAKVSWSPLDMIDLCTAARPGTPDERLARRLQRSEMRILLTANAAALQCD
jgi:hypothetical protein